MPIHEGTSAWSLSETDAVNMLLATIGAAPVNSVDTASVDAVMAKNTLKEISLSVQAMGWYFNTDNAKKWSPDSSGNIYIPYNEQVMSVDNAYQVENVPYETREVAVKTNSAGFRVLYDVTNKTFVFDSPVVTKTVYAYPWNSLPHEARYYIAIRAARVFQDRAVGSEKSHTFTLRDEQYALAALRHLESETADYSIFQNYSVARVIDRNYPYTARA